MRMLFFFTYRLLLSHMQGLDIMVMYFPRYLIASTTTVFRRSNGCWLCWGLTSQSTIFQSYRDGAIASWVINQYFRGVKCLAQGHNTAAVGLEPRTSRSGVRHSTTEPPRSPCRSNGISGKVYAHVSNCFMCKRSNLHIYMTKKHSYMFT